MLYLEVISRRAIICLLENQKERREIVIEKIENKFLRKKTQIEGFHFLQNQWKEVQTQRENCETRSPNTKRKP